jgi:hypothetical protein
MMQVMRKSTRTVLMLMGASTATIGQASGQFPAAPKELGMGGAYLGVARGYEAVFLAPANLGLSDAPVWSVGLPQIALGGTLLGPRFGELMDLVDYTDLSDARQEELMATIPAAGTEGAFTLRAPVVAVSIGGLGLGATYTSTGRHTISRDVTELLLRGYEDGRSTYSVGDTHGELATYWDFAAGYAARADRISLGITAHYLRGGALSRTRLFEPRIDVAAGEIEVDYVGVNARGGSGYAVDIGVAFQATPDVTISGALSNALSSMNWSDDLYARTLTLDRASIADANPMTLRKQYMHSDTPVDPNAIPDQVAAAAMGLYDRAITPAVARLGVAWQAMPGTHLAADFHRTSTAGEVADPWDQRIALGFQQSLSIFSFRGGYARGSQAGRLLSAGLSVGPLDLGVARYDHNVGDNDRSQGWIATFGLGTQQRW